MSVFLDGRSLSPAEIIEFEGFNLGSFPVAPLGYARVLYDKAIQSFMLSENGGDYYSFLTINSDIPLDFLAGATYSNLQDWFNTTQSSGKISGGAFTSNGNGTVNVSSGAGIIRATNSAIANAFFFDWPANTSLALVDDSTNYIFVDYNSGAPIIGSETANTGNNRSKIMLGKIFREGNNLHLVEAGMAISEGIKKTLTYLTQVFGEVTRASGVAIAEKNQRYLVSTNGVLFAGLTRIATTGVDTTGANTFELYYYNGSAWIESDESQIDNVNYNNIASGLAELTPNRYGVFWVYGDADGHLMIVYGQDNYTLSNAEAADPPTSLPNHVSEFGFIAAKIIVKKNATNLYSVGSAYKTAFTSSGVVIHNETSSLQGGKADEYYHLTEDESNGSGENFVLASQIFS